MSNFVLQRMEGRIGVARPTVPLTFTGTLMAEEMSIAFIVVKVSAASAGVNGGNPATMLVETSYDDGVSWDTATGVTAQSITGTGKFFAYFTSDVFYIGPIIRVTITPPGGETVTISEVRKARVTAPAMFRSAPLTGSTMATIAGNAQEVAAGNVTVPTMLTYIMGFDGTAHREILTDATGRMITTDYPSGTSVVSSRIDYAATPVTTLAWVQVTAATASDATWWYIWESSGKTLEIGIGGAGAETRVALVPPGGLEFRRALPAGTRVAVRAVSGNAVAGEMNINIF